VGEMVQGKAAITAAAGAVVVDTRESRHARLRPLSVAATRLTDRFWEPRRAINRATTLPEQHRLCVETGRFDNFRRAAGSWQGPFQGRVFNDSDVYKWLEAVSWTLADDDDPALRALADDAIAIIAAAQGVDGYLNTYFTFEHEAERWTDLRVQHELYCAGHLFQAAVAHHRVTGSTALLDVATRLADHLDATFGPGRRPGTCGHPEVEMGLLELARETGEVRYRDLAAFFLAQRGQHPSTLIGSGERAPNYYQDHAPVRDQREATGHAVRALYLYAGMTDLHTETGEDALHGAIDAIWDDLRTGRTYVTGGVGARHEGEAIGDRYELPNARAYAETCAAIASVMWNWRLLLLTGQGRYADALEEALYNGVLSGLALDGETYFYVNPLADRGEHRRQPWFGTACCPPNIARLLASLPGYVATTSDEGLWVHLYAESTTVATVPGVGAVTLTQQTDYPWDGAIAIEVTPEHPAAFTLFLRLPGWVADQAGASLTVNDTPLVLPLIPGEYVAIAREWTPGDRVNLTLPLAVRRIFSHPHVAENRGRAALARGPLVYCLEGVDHPGVDVWDLALPHDARWEAVWQPELLGGVMVLWGQGCVAEPAPSVQRSLYTPTEPQPENLEETAITAIPYYAWANREPGPMQVWIPLA